MRDSELRQLRQNQATANVSETERDAFVEGVDDGREGPTDLDDPTT